MVENTKNPSFTRANIDAGLIAAQIAAAEEAKRYGHKLIYWENGAIIEVAPEEILALYTDTQRS